MSSISYSFNAVNASGNYTIQVKNCTGSSLIYTGFKTGAATSGSVTGTLTDASLNTDLGSIKLVIFDTANNAIINTSGCFNHNCSSCVSISDYTLTTSNNIAYGATINCSISGENGSTPYVYTFRLKQNGTTIATNTDNSVSSFAFTNNVCPNLGAVTVEASVTNCGATITKTNTITISAAIAQTPVLGSVCYVGSGQWTFTVNLNLGTAFPETVVGLFEDGTDNFISYFDGTGNPRSVTTDNVTFGRWYYAKITNCNVTSPKSNTLQTDFIAC